MDARDSTVGRPGHDGSRIGSRGATRATPLPYPFAFASSTAKRVLILRDASLLRMRTFGSLPHPEEARRAVSKGEAKDRSPYPFAFASSNGSEPAQPASPQPLTPSGLVVQGTGCEMNPISTVSDARGMA